MIILLIIFILIFAIPYVVIDNFSNYYVPPGQKKPEPFETVSVYISSSDEVREMNTSQYLKEVVSAEMPAEFETEALKAQATAARTYLVNRIQAGNEEAKTQHKGADICTDASHCKAWTDEKTRRESWDAEKSDAYWKKISDAVEDTSGVLITYENKPISALFHSTSSGFTENAVDVWGGNVPYLVSVESKGEENSPKFSSERTLSIQEFMEIAEGNFVGIDWNKGLIGDIVRSDAGGIKTIVIGGVEVKGTAFRLCYQLRSTNVSVTVTDTNVVMQVTGYGHGVGMSQYGANYLASQGLDYKEILKTYYTGVEVE